MSGKRRKGILLSEKSIAELADGGRPSFARYYLKAHFGEELTTDFNRNPFLWDLLYAKFGLERSDVGRLTETQIGELLRELERRESAPINGKISKARRPNQERDDFVVARYLDGTPVKEILAKVKARKDWAPVSKPSHARNIYVRHCKRHGIDPSTRK